MRAGRADVRRSPMLSTRERLDSLLDGDARAEELGRLEALWQASAVAEPELDAPSSPEIPRERAGRRLGWLLAGSWVAFLAAVVVLAPPSQEPLASEPLWVQYVVVGLWLALPLAAVGGAMRSAWLGYGASLSAAGMAVALSIACTTTGHHDGSWWAYELGGSLALVGLSLAGLRRARRGAREE
jgi:hypothetical protein